MKAESCYIFTRHLDEEGCLTVSFDETKEAQLSHKTYAELQSISLDTDCIVVIPSEKISLHRLELPWLPEKKARIAIPFAMEEKLAESVDALHFSFDKRYYQQGEYLIAVCNKDYFATLIARLKEKHIPVERITIEWFALEPHDIVLYSGFALIRNDDFLGSLGKEFTSFYPFKEESNQIYSFDPEYKGPTTHTYPKEEFPIFIAHRLEKKPLFNLSQGGFQTLAHKFNTQRLYQIAAGLFGLWVLSLFAVNGFTLHQLNKQIDKSDAVIARVYKEFFPNAKQVISPRFRIEQALKAQKDNNSQLWELLNTLGIVLKNNPSAVEMVKYQNNRIQITLTSKDFDTLEALQLALQKEHIQVKQNQASTKENKVVSTLELTI